MIGSLLQIRPAINSTSNYIPIVLQLLISVLAVGVLFILAFRFKSRENTRSSIADTITDMEFGKKEDIDKGLKYFMISTLFVLFLAAVIVLFPYAVDMRGIGWDGFATGTLFVCFLLCGLFYAIRKGIE